ncbi:aldolase/citrate lyase family protein [Blastococcus sp. BMG 814]|uniref:Aldolase/citrate lyase family protein n=1 Tax=Blastococcus carthaginiensis TaxID=3050034 RepID=A0ABT9IE79_9ACTN|nr:aldolase/citrate lyase family protein [Blastococcus carthaginiensis]MDP5183891.1 aldolase/citrate lyase family protein [Blastococcus carthaginiensis]
MTIPYLRRALATGPVVGTFLKLPRPEVVDVLAGCGVDFVVCDHEHAQISEREAREVIRAGRAVGLPVIVRVPDLDRGLINRLLEAGAAGIQLARAESGTGRPLGDLMRYPPEGTRSVSPAQPAAGYGAIPLTTFLPRSNADVLAVGQLETASAAADPDAAVAGLDVAFIGPVDLRVALGHADDPDHPDVTQAVTGIRAAAARAGIPVGTYVAGPDEVAAAVGNGYRYVVVSSDLALLAAGARTVLGRR